MPALTYSEMAVPSPFFISVQARRTNRTQSRPIHEDVAAGREGAVRPHEKRGNACDLVGSSSALGGASSIMRTASNMTRSALPRFAK